MPGNVVFMMTPRLFVPFGVLGMSILPLTNGISSTVFALPDVVANNGGGDEAATLRTSGANASVKRPMLITHKVLSENGGNGKFMKQPSM